MATFDPDSPSLRAIPRPIPREPPVTSAYFPLSVIKHLLAQILWRMLGASEPHVNQRGCGCGRCGRRVFIARTPLQTPMMAPESSTSMEDARETFGRPGMSIMLPEITTTNPAAAESEALVTLSVQPVGAPRRFGSSDKEYCVLAMQTGNFP